MQETNVGVLVSKLRMVGVGVSAENGSIRCRTMDGRKPTYEALGLLEQLRGLGMIAVDFLQREALGEQLSDSPKQPGDFAGGPNDLASLPGSAVDGITMPEPDANGIVRLVRVSPEVAFSAGDLINDGKAELIGKVIYRRLSNVFDVTFTTCWPSL